MTRFPEKLLLSTIVAVAALIVPKQAGGQTLGFVGDVMIHSSQLRRAWLGEDDRGVDSGYDFTPTFEWFAPYLLTPDLMLGNLETTFGGPNSALVTDEKYAFREYQAYPTFTTPDSLASALKAAGFDVMVTANNHSMDSGLGGAARTLTVLKEEGLEATGTSRSGRPVPWRGRVGDFNLSVLAWTASVNGLIASRGMEAINVFNARGHDGRLEEMLNDIRAEAERQPDLVILFIHW
ncbi:MAG: CapA family protein, partial [Spirochaetaceae bacterium]|nr:CapA family protein [Spirochaetaceae bacterium]